MVNNIEYTSKKRKVVGFIEKIAVPSFKHVIIHLLIAIILAVILVITLRNKSLIDSDSFVNLVSNLGIISGAMLAISIAVAIFFSGHITNWRDKLTDRLDLVRIELSNQMAKSAKLYPEIANRLVELYMKSVYFIPGQAIQSEEIFDASRIYDDWAVKETKQAIGKNQKFSFGDLASYDTFAKHLFDASLSATKVRSTLILLGVAERASRVISVFPPLLLTWSIVVLLSIMFTVLESTGVTSDILYFPLLMLMIYLMLVALLSFTIGSCNIIMFITRVLETGHEKAMEELAEKLGQAKSPKE